MSVTKNVKQISAEVSDESKTYLSLYTSMQMIKILSMA